MAEQKFLGEAGTDVLVQKIKDIKPFLIFEPNKFDAYIDPRYDFYHACGLVIGDCNVGFAASSNSISKINSIQLVEFGKNDGIHAVCQYPESDGKTTVYIKLNFDGVWGQFRFDPSYNNDFIAGKTIPVTYIPEESSISEITAADVTNKFA